VRYGDDDILKQSIAESFSAKGRNIVAAKANHCSDCAVTRRRHEIRDQQIGYVFLQNTEHFSVSVKSKTRPETIFLKFSPVCKRVEQILSSRTMEFWAVRSPEALIKA
jgi:hypothetical protein